MCFYDNLTFNLKYLFSVTAQFEVINVLLYIFMDSSITLVVIQNCLQLMMTHIDTTIQLREELRLHSTTSGRHLPSPPVASPPDVTCFTKMTTYNYSKSQVVEMSMHVGGVCMLQVVPSRQ